VITLSTAPIAGDPGQQLDVTASRANLGAFDTNSAWSTGPEKAYLYTTVGWQTFWFAVVLPYSRPLCDIRPTVRSIKVTL